MEKSQSLLVLGGSSDIGRACALRFAESGAQIMLAGRDLEALQREAQDIAVRTGAKASLHKLDILDADAFESFVHDLPALPDTVICVIGLLGEQLRAETEVAYASRIIRTNCEGPAILLGLFAERFLARGSGAIVGVSSVAGERGRASNYVYGAGKAGLTAFSIWLKEPAWQDENPGHHRQAGLRAHPHDKRHETSTSVDGRAGRGSGSDLSRGHSPAARRYLRQTDLADRHDDYQGDPGADFQAAPNLIRERNDCLPARRSSMRPASDRDLSPDFNYAVGRQAEKVGDLHDVAVHRGEEPSLPCRRAFASPRLMTVSRLA